MTWEQQEAARREVLERRQRLLRTGAVNGLAQAAVQTADSAEQADRAVGELERHAGAAKNINSRLAVLNQTMVLIAREVATQNQLLATSLHIQAAQAAMGTVDQGPMDPDGKTPQGPSGFPGPRQRVRLCRFSGYASPPEGTQGMTLLVETAENGVVKVFKMAAAIAEQTSWNDPVVPLIYALLLFAPYFILLVVYFAQEVVSIFRVMMLAAPPRS